MFPSTNFPSIFNYKIQDYAKTVFLTVKSTP